MPQNQSLCSKKAIKKHKIELENDQVDVSQIQVCDTAMEEETCVSLSSAPETSVLLEDAVECTAVKVRQTVEQASSQVGATVELEDIDQLLSMAAVEVQFIEQPSTPSAIAIETSELPDAVDLPYIQSSSSAVNSLVDEQLEALPSLMPVVVVQFTEEPSVSISFESEHSIYVQEPSDMENSEPQEATTSKSEVIPTKVHCAKPRNIVPIVIYNETDVINLTEPEVYDISDDDYDDVEKMECEALTVHKKTSKVTVQCNLCNRNNCSSSDTKLVITREESKLKDQYNFNCEHCQLQFTDIQELFLHFQGEHEFNSLKTKSNIIKASNTCKQCKFKANDKFEFIRHVHQHKNTIPCLFCCKGFDERKSLQSHIHQEHFACMQCNFKFSSHLHFNYHINEQHKSNNMFKCIYCNIQFKQFKNALAHVHTTHPQCENCVLEFLKDSSTRSKKLTPHTSDEKLAIEQQKQCHYCFALLKVSEFVNHLQTQHSIYRCTYCGSFIVITNLEHNPCIFCSSSNKILESKQDSIIDQINNCSMIAYNDLQCEHCKGNFSTLTNLLRHNKQCLNKKHLFTTDFICHICSKKYATREIITRHMKKCVDRNMYITDGHMNLEDISPTDGENSTFDCKYCKSVFETYDDLRQHLVQCLLTASRQKNRKRHRGKRNIAGVCNTCCRPFIRVEDYRTHIKRHEILAFNLPCNICNAQIPRKNLSAHLHNEHNYCLACSERFSDTDEFEQHETQHKNNEICLYKCYSCYKFKSKDRCEYMFHMREEHNVTFTFYPRPEPVKLVPVLSDTEVLYDRSFKIPCAYCGTHLTNQQLFAEHVRNIHNVQQCEACQQFSFNTFCNACQ